MKSNGKRFSAAICLILLAACCLAALLFACEGTVTLSLSLSADPTPGAILEPSLEFSGAEKKVKFYSEKDYVLAITKGESVASVEGGKVKIADAAAANSEFTLRATVESLSIEKTFRVSASPVERVGLTAPESAEAGESYILSATVTGGRADIPLRRCPASGTPPRRGKRTAPRPSPSRLSPARIPGRESTPPAIPPTP